jgi:hypothetical protein
MNLIKQKNPDRRQGFSQLLNNLKSVVSFHLLVAGKNFHQLATVLNYLSVSFLELESKS